MDGVGRGRGRPAPPPRGENWAADRWGGSGGGPHAGDMGPPQQGPPPPREWARGAQGGPTADRWGPTGGVVSDRWRSQGGSSGKLFTVQVLAVAGSGSCLTFADSFQTANLQTCMRLGAKCYEFCV